MKRVVFFFLLFTLSHAFHPETLDLTQVFNHHHHKHHHHLPSSDGSDSSKILLPTDSSSVLDNTQSYVVEFKEAVSESEILPEDSNPVQLKTRHSFPVYKFNPIRCRQIHRFMRHPRRFDGVNKLGFDPVLTYVLQNRDVARKFPEVERAIRMFDRHHMGPLHHPRHHHDHQRVEMKEEEDDEERENEVEKKRKEKDDEEEERENKVEKKHKKKDVEKKRKDKDGKKKRKEKDDDEEEKENEVEKKRKERNDDEENEDKEKDVLKNIRKFLNYF